jgi:UPF0716 family protein affecting phage T7 exclusion
VSSFVLAAATKSSASSALAILFFTVAAFMLGGVISFAMRKRWIGVGVTAVLAIGSALVGLSYYRTFKGH